MAGTVPGGLNSKIHTKVHSSEELSPVTDM